MELKWTDEKRKAPYGDDLCRAVFPIYYLGKLCGLVPVRFYVHASEGCQARLNIVDLVYSLCVLILLLGSEIWGLWRDLKDGWEHSTRLKSRTAVIATCSDVVGVMGLTVVCIVGSPFRWKYLQLVMNKLIEVDGKIGVSSPKRARRFTICLTICSLTYLWFNSIIDFYTWDRKTENKMITDKGPINYAPLYLMYTVIISTEIQYTVATYNVGRRFVRLNDNLKSLLDASNSSNDNAIGYFRKFSETAGNKKRCNITSKRQLVLGSYKLSRKMDCKLVSLINTTFGVVLLAVTVTCLLHLVITPYFLILQAKASEKHEWIFLFVQAGWCIIHITRMLIIVQPSYSTVAEGKRTATLVSQLLSCSFDADTRRELEIFSLQLLHRPLEFSACGLFSLDRNLITSIAGAVTTNLVILVQY
ncbi:hypothetical protein QLX08_010378 [Tetragonisca angustula]|uniref:Gustatory receptor n=1 Tax=Tetragonisca angustula TaxID=166442 RepID=A0AAW0ZCC4_9HYME